MRFIIKFLTLAFFAIGVVMLYTSWLVGVGYFIYQTVKSDISFWITLFQSLGIMVGSFVMGLLSIMLSAVFSTLTPE